MLVAKDGCNGWFDYEGMVCDADGTEWEATCQRVVSESNLTAAADGVLLCIGPQHGDDGEEYHGQDDHAPGCDPSWLGDWECDSACDNEAWGFDMGDCDNSGPDPDSGFDILPGCARELVICQDTMALTKPSDASRCMTQFSRAHARPFCVNFPAPSSRHAFLMRGALPERSFGSDPSGYHPIAPRMLPSDR